MHKISFVGMGYVGLCTTICFATNEPAILLTTGQALTKDSFV